VGFLASALPAALWAQNPDRTLPREPERNRTPSTLPVVSGDPAFDNDATPVVQELRAVVIAPPGSATTRPAATPPKGVVVEPEFLKDRADLIASLAARIGKPLSLKDLNAVAAEIVTTSRAAGRPVVDVVVPEQDITDGVVRLVLVEGKLGKVRVEGERRAVVAERVPGQVRLRQGEPIVADSLLDDVDWINRRSPFRRFEALFEKGQLPGETDVVLQRSGTRYPLRVYSSFENTGSRTTGDDRIVAGFNWGDAFGLGKDHQLGYQFTTDDEFRRFHAHGITYSVPLPWRHIASMSGTWSRQEPDFDDARFESVGESWQVSGRYEIPLRKRQDRSLSQSVVLGVDVKRSNNNLEFGGEQVFDRASQTVQFQVEYRFDKTSNLGTTEGSAALVVSPGYLASDNDEAAYDEARRGAEPRYAYLTTSLGHTFTLGRGFDLSARLSAQLSTGPLLSSEQFGIGGADTVRGYAERELNADNGVLASIELLMPEVSPLKLAGFQKFNDSLRPFVFFDAGAGWNYQGDDATPSSVHAISAGPGVRYRVSDYGSVDVAYGFRLSDRSVADDESGRTHFRVSATFAW
jgi:hemolysin activation/secretion protein